MTRAESKIWMFGDIILDKDRKGKAPQLKVVVTVLKGTSAFLIRIQNAKKCFPWTLMVMMLEVVVPSGRYAGIVVV